MKIRVAIIVVLVGVLLGGWWFMKSQRFMSAPTSQYPTPTPAGDLQIVKSQTTTSEFAPTTSSPISLNAIPQALAFLGATNIGTTTQISRTTFDSGKPGYTFSYLYPSSLSLTHQYFNEFALANHLTHVEGTRTDQASVIVVKNAEYLIRFELLKVQDNQTSVTAFIQHIK